MTKSIKAKFHLLLIILLASITYSCQNDKGKKTDFMIEKKLIGEKVPMKEVVSPEFMTKTDDFLLISSSGDTMIFSYAIPSLEHKSHTGVQGGGPDDFSPFPMFCETNQNSNIYIWGYTPQTIRKFSINNEGQSVFEKEFLLKNNEEFNNMYIINDSLFLYYLMEELCIKKYDLIGEHPIDEIRMEKENHRESYFYSNRGNFIANDSTIVFAYQFKKQIDIYDLHTLKLKTVITDNKKYPKPIVRDIKNTMHHYMNIVAGKDFFYAMYHGVNGNVGADTDVIEVYDYEGNAVKKYSFDSADTFPYLFVVDESKGYIYGYNQRQEDYLLRFPL
jgi:hypothetical protein